MKLPYDDKYHQQGDKCASCGRAIEPGEYCVINTPEGIRVIHYNCLRQYQVGGCHAQIEVLYKP